MVLYRLHESYIGECTIGFTWAVLSQILMLKFPVIKSARCCTVMILFSSPKISQLPIPRDTVGTRDSKRQHQCPVMISLAFAVLLSDSLWSLPSSCFTLSASWALWPAWHMLSGWRSTMVICVAKKTTMGHLHSRVIQLIMIGRAMKMALANEFWAKASRPIQVKAGNYQSIL